MLLVKHVCVCSPLTSFYLEVEYWDGWSQIKVHTDDRTQAHGAQSSLAVARPSINRCRRCLTSVNVPPWSPSEPSTYKTLWIVIVSGRSSVRERSLRIFKPHQDTIYWIWLRGLVDGLNYRRLNPIIVLMQFPTKIRSTSYKTVVIEFFIMLPKPRINDVNSLLLTSWRQHP